MSNSDIFVSIVYVLYVIAPAIRPELWLRVALFINSFGFALWGLWIESWPVVVANALFCLISLRQIRRAYFEQRPVTLPPDAALIGSTLFPTMDDRDLERFWSIGEPQAVSKADLLSRGETSDLLYALVEGDVSIELADGTVLVRTAPTVIGEMSTLSGEPATATVRATNARVVSWKKTEIELLQHAYPSFTGPFLKGLATQMAFRLTQ